MWIWFLIVLLSFIFEIKDPNIYIMDRQNIDVKQATTMTYGAGAQQLTVPLVVAQLPFGNIDSQLTPITTNEQTQRF